ncbi:MAG: hypothetical protein JJV98_15960, partial [Desulfosarcina sp.]|nr:hypothetical protein [Desulfobacterales bacterium]
MHTVITIIVFMDVLCFALAIHYLRADRQRRKNRQRLRQIVNAENPALTDPQASAAGPAARWAVLHAGLDRLGLARPLDNLLAGG